MGQRPRKRRLGDCAPLKKFLNRCLAETWEETGQGGDAKALAARAEDYEPGCVPASPCRAVTTYVQLPKSLTLNNAFEHMTAARLMPITVQGKASMRWITPHGKREEGGDCVIYAYAVACHLGIQIYREPIRLSGGRISLAGFDRRRRTMGIPRRIDEMQNPRNNQQRSQFISS